MFFVGGFWNAPDACVNGGAFRQDERDGRNIGYLCDLVNMVDMYHNIK